MQKENDTRFMPVDKQQMPDGDYGKSHSSAAKVAAGVVGGLAAGAAGAYAAGQIADPEEEESPESQPQETPASQNQAKESAAPKPAPEPAPKSEHKLEPELKAQLKEVAEHEDFLEAHDVQITDVESRVGDNGETYEYAIGAVDGHKAVFASTEDGKVVATFVDENDNKIAEPQEIFDLRKENLTMRSLMDYAQSDPVSDPVAVRITSEPGDFVDENDNKIAEPQEIFDLHKENLTMRSLMDYAQPDPVSDPVAVKITSEPSDMHVNVQVVSMPMEPAEEPVQVIATPQYAEHTSVVMANIYTGDEPVESVDTEETEPVGCCSMQPVMEEEIPASIPTDNQVGDLPDYSNNDDIPLYDI